MKNRCTKTNCKLGENERGRKEGRKSFSRRSRCGRRRKKCSNVVVFPVPRKKMRMHGLKKREERKGEKVAAIKENENSSATPRGRDESYDPRIRSWERRGLLLEALYAKSQCVEIVFGAYGAMELQHLSSVIEGSAFANCRQPSKGNGKSIKWDLKRVSSFLRRYLSDHIHPSCDHQGRKNIEIEATPWTVKNFLSFSQFPPSQRCS